MRINKKLIPASDKSKDTYLRFSAETFWVFWASMLLIAGFCAGLFFLYTGLTNSSAEVARLNSHCNLIAGKQPHFLASISGSPVCKVAPNWNGVSL